MKKTTYYSKTAEKNSLSIIKIETEEELKNSLDSGLTSLYQNVFAEPPYNEQFTPTEVEDTFKDCLKNKGHIFLVSENTGKPVAFVASISLSSDFNLSSIVKSSINPESTAYFAEEGVEKDLRRNGLSSDMKKILIDACSEQGLERLLLRTNVYNYKQISAVNKAGGSVIKDLFQNVSSTRSDGTMSQDSRSFYVFDLNKSNEQNITKLERVTIVRPGGNDTAIVWDKVSRQQQGDVSLKIQKTYPGVEQVMFAENGNNGLQRGQMAGGEFCGNATRSFGYLQLKGNDGEVVVEVSGASAPMKVVVDNGMSKTSLPVKNDLSSAQPDPNCNGDYNVHLEGISFIITSSDKATGKKINSETSESSRKESAKKVLEESGFAKNFPASGVMIADRQEDGSYKLDPYVFVRSTGTMYYETGCGSGSTSVGLMVAKETGSTVKDLKITQPSGMNLLVSVDRNDKEFKSAFVNGPIEVLFDGRMYISEATTKNNPTKKISI